MFSTVTICSIQFMLSDLIPFMHEDWTLNADVMQWLAAQTQWNIELHIAESLANKMVLQPLVQIANVKQVQLKRGNHQEGRAHVSLIIPCLFTRAVF